METAQASAGMLQLFLFTLKVCMFHSQQHKMNNVVKLQIVQNISQVSLGC